MNTYTCQSFTVNYPKSFEKGRSGNSFFRADFKTDNFGVQCPFLEINLTEISAINTQKGDSFIEKYITWTEQYKSEVISKLEVEIQGYKAYELLLKTDAEFQNQQLKITFHNACILVNNEFCYDVLFCYETDKANQYEIYWKEIITDINLVSDATTLSGALATDAKATQISYQELLANQEQEKLKEEARELQSLNFALPTNKDCLFNLEGFEINEVSETTLWYIGKENHKLNVDIGLTIKDVKKGIKEQLLSEWISDSGEVQFNFSASSIFQNGIPFGTFIFQNGKCENKYVDLRIKDFYYTLKFHGKVFLQNNYFALEGWLQNEFDNKSKFRIQVYKNFKEAALEWVNYQFNKKEFEEAQVEEVAFLNYEDEGLQTFPTKILNCTNLKELSLKGGSTTWGGNAWVSSYAPMTQIPSEIGSLNKLNSLSISNFELATLPESISQLTALEKLYIHACKITELPKSIFHLPKLKHLSITSTALNMLPEEVNLPELLSLSFKKNKLTILPEAFAHQSQLLYLYLEENPWEKLPQKLSDSTIQINLPIEDKRRLLDYTYKGADGKGTISWVDSQFYVDPKSEGLQTIKQIIEEENLTAYKTALLAQVKRAIGFKVVENKQTELGEHRFGGLPDLPISIDYPRFGENWRDNKTDYCYEFIAQINCEEVAHLQDYLPKKGFLFFFLTTIHDVYDDTNAAKVIYFDGTKEDLVSCERFQFEEDDYSEVIDSPPYSPMQVKATHLNAIPDYYAATQNKHWFKVEGGEALLKKIESEDYNDQDHIYDMYEEPIKNLQSYDFAINSYMFTQHESPELQAALKKKGNPEDWIILLKVPSVGDFQWGDAGDLAFVIHKSDLLKRDFTNIFCCIESS